MERTRERMFVGFYLSCVQSKTTAFQVFCRIMKPYLCFTRRVSSNNLPLPQLASLVEHHMIHFNFHNCLLLIYHVIVFSYFYPRGAATCLPLIRKSLCAATKH